MRVTNWWDNPKYVIYEYGSSVDHWSLSVASVLFIFVNNWAKEDQDQDSNSIGIGLVLGLA